MFELLSPRINLHDFRVEYDSAIDPPPPNSDDPDRSCASSFDKPILHAFRLNSCSDCKIYNITGVGGFGLFSLGADLPNSRTVYEDINFTKIDAALGGKCIELFKGTSQYLNRVRCLMTNKGTADTRGILIKSTGVNESEVIDTVRFDDVVAYSAAGMPTVVTIDFGAREIANLRIWRSVFDSAEDKTMEILATTPTNVPVGQAPPLTDMSQLSIRETRMGADTGVGSGIRVYLQNPNAYIKGLEISDNYIVSKASGGGYFIELDPTSAGYIRAAKITGNSFGAALPTPSSGSVPNMNAAVRIGMSNVLLANNTLQSAKEGAAVQDGKVDHFVKVTKDITNVVLVGNAAMFPLAGSFLDRLSYQVVSGREIGLNINGVSQETLFSAVDSATSDAAGGTTITGLRRLLKPNTAYRVTGTFRWQSAATATGAGFGFGLSFPPPAGQYASTCLINTDQAGGAPAASIPTFVNRRAPNTLAPTGSVDAADAAMLTTCTASFRTGPEAGNYLAARFRPSNSTLVTVLAGSSMQIDEN